MEIEIKKYTFKEIFCSEHEEKNNDCQKCKNYSTLEEKDSRGVYMFFDNNNKSIYIGKSLYFRDRIWKYANPKYSKTKKEEEIAKEIQKNHEKGYCIFIFIKGVLQIEEVERKLIYGLQSNQNDKNASAENENHQYGNELFYKNSELFINELNKVNELDKEIKSNLIKTFKKQ